jgi:hypothetical protein
VGGSASPVDGDDTQTDDAQTGQRVDSRFDRTVLVLAVLIGVAAALLAVYGRYVNGLRPGVSSPKGFYGFSDQSLYLLTSQVLAHWRLPVGTTQYHFGLGYPILAVPFTWLGFRGDPFAPVDVLAFGATVALTFVVATRVRVFDREPQRLLFGVAVAAVTALATPLLMLASTPWNTNVDVALGLAVLVIVTSRRRIGRARALTLGIAVSWIFASRFVDALFLGLPIIVAFVLRTAPERRRILLYGGAAVVVVVGAVFATQQYAFGSWLATPYQFHTQTSTGADDQSIHQYRLAWIPSHFTGTFLTGSADGKREPRDPLLRDFPLLALAPFGAVAVARRRDRNRPIWMAVATTSLVATVFYLSFIAARVTDLKYGNLRYWAAWYPLWALLAVAAIVRGVTGATERLLRDDRGDEPLCPKW